MRYLSLIGMAFALSMSAAAQEQRNFSAEDLVKLDRISDPQASPDGSRIAFVVRKTDMEADKGITSIWQVDVDGRNMRQLTSADASDSQPRWSGDGANLYFISTRSGSVQLWRLPLAGGEARQVSDLPLDINTYVLSPTGDWLVFSVDVFRDCDTLSCTRQRLDDIAASKVSAQHYDRLFMRQWDTWKDHRRSVLFSVALNATGDLTGEPIALSAALDTDVPGKPFSGSEDIGFSADGRFVIFAARNAAGSMESWSTNFDLFRAASDGAGELENLTSENPAWDSQPAVSPDGKTLAYLAMARAGFESDRFRIVLLDFASGRRRVLTENWDRSIASLAWSKDGRYIFATAQDTGNRPLWRIDTRTGTPAMLASDGLISSFTIAGSRLVFARSNLGSPTDLFRVQINGSEVRRLTGINDEALASLRLGEFEQFSFAGWNGEAVHGYLVKPADFKPGKQYPVAFLIHGGPQGSFSNDFHYRWNPQTYAGQGFAAVMIDFHGSTGYGQAFTDSISEDWGGKPLEDLQKGLAAALANYTWLDGDRVCALGGSYGGYMINWIAGNWPERFRCLVNHDGIFDNRMMYYTTEELWFPEWENGGPQFLHPQNYETFNPVNFVDKWQTPMLVVHGALDYRVPDTQGIATFTALQRKGIPSEILYFPNENHWVLRPHNSMRWHEEVNRWLHRWLDVDR